MYVCMSVAMYVCINDSHVLCVYVYMYMYACNNMHANMFVCSYIIIFVHACTNVATHSYRLILIALT